MRNKIADFFMRNIIYLGAALGLVLVLVLFRSDRDHLEVRQPLNVSTVQPLSRAFEVKKSLLSAKRSAERLDDEAGRLVKVSDMGLLERWSKGVDRAGLQKQYSRDLLAHLKAMSSLLKHRREMGGLKKLQEFDFQNLVRKSDYLLALPVAKESLKTFRRDSVMQEKWLRTLSKYNSEREKFDSKRIVIAER